MGRNNEVRIKLSKEELDKVERQAAIMGMPISTYMRFISLNAIINVQQKN